MDKSLKSIEQTVLEEQIPMIDISQPDDDDVFFPIDETAWQETPLSQLSLQIPRHHDTRADLYFQSNDISVASCGSYSNSGFQDFQRQQSNLYSPFDTDTVFLFNSPKNRRFNLRKLLAKVWCYACLLTCWRSLCCSCLCDCSCRDQQGVHCMYRLKETIKKKLKVVQGVMCLVTVIQSGMVFMPLGTVTSDFDGQCLLNSSLFIYRNRNNTVSLDEARSVFGKKEDCDFTTFVNVVVAIVGLFFIWFFIHTSLVSGLEQIESKLQLPVLLCYLILFVSVTISSFKITIGFNAWCFNLVANNPLKLNGERLQCKDYEKLHWNPETRSIFYTYFVLAEISSWLLTFTLILKLSVNSLHLYLKFKTVYQETEVVHARLDESSESSAEASVWGSGDLLLSQDRPAQMPVYKVEYKTHQILAKVVIHRDSPIQRFDPKETFVLDKEKFKRNLSAADKLTVFRQPRKIDFPLSFDQSRRRRLNWTGSCEELQTDSKFDAAIVHSLAVRSLEWHGFDTYIDGVADDVGFGGSSWQASFGSQHYKVGSVASFEWPAGSPGSSCKKRSSGDSSGSLHRLYFFENDFVKLKRSSSLPDDWLKFDAKLSRHKEDKLSWSDVDIAAGSLAKDPWMLGSQEFVPHPETQDEDVASREKEDSTHLGSYTTRRHDAHDLGGFTDSFNSEC